MRSGDGGRLGPLLGEQAAYYQATAGDYWDRYLELPGGLELTAALDAFRPAGRVLELACADELVEGPSSPVIRRELSDGTPYRLVKVPHEPAILQEQLGRIGWSITVTPTTGPFPFYWGAGTRSL
jgi:hypothetical protein